MPHLPSINNLHREPKVNHRLPLPAHLDVDLIDFVDHRMAPVKGDVDDVAGFLEAFEGFGVQGKLGEDGEVVGRWRARVERLERWVLLTGSKRKERSEFVENVSLPESSSYNPLVSLSYPTHHKPPLPTPHKQIKRIRMNMRRRPRPRSPQIEMNAFRSPVPTAVHGTNDRVFLFLLSEKDEVD